MAWTKLGTTTLTETTSTVTVTGMTAKKFVTVLIHAKSNTTNGDFELEYHGDSNNNYSNRTSFNSGSDYTQTSINFLRPLGTTANLPFFDVHHIINISDEEKLITGQAVQINSSGAGDTMTRTEYVGKWANTSNQMTEVKAKLRVGSYTSDSNVTVIGTD